jgi:hypothetical protein
MLVIPASWAGDGVAATEDAQNQIREFLRAVDKPRPTLADYYRFIGEGAELEAAFLYKECEEKGWCLPSDMASAFDIRRSVSRIDSTRHHATLRGSRSDFLNPETYLLLPSSRFLNLFSSPTS